MAKKKAAVIKKKITKKVAKRTSQNTSNKSSIRSNQNVDSKAKRKTGLAIAALVCGCLFWIGWLGFIMSILALVFGVVARKNALNNPEVYGGKRMAKAGIVLGIIGLCIFALILIGLIIFGIAVLSGWLDSFFSGMMSAAIR